MISINSIPAARLGLMDLPYPILKVLLHKLETGDIFSITNNDAQLEKKVAEFKIPVGAYNLSFTRPAGICIPGKNFSWKLNLCSSKEMVERITGVFEELRKQFPGHLDTLRIDPTICPGSLTLVEPCKRQEIIVNREATDREQERVYELMESLQVTDSVKISAPRIHVDVEKIRHLESIEISCGKWLGKEHLMRMDSSKRVHIGTNCLKSSDINYYLWQWFYQSEPKLEVLTVNRFDAGTQEDILLELPTSPFDPEVRGKRYFAPESSFAYRSSDGKPILVPEDFMEGVDMSKAVDIRRPDGLIASVLVKEHQLVVVVWKDRFPGKKVAEKLNEEIKEEFSKIVRNIGWMRRNKMREDLIAENNTAHKLITKKKRMIQICNE